jgi:hypothetical protein
MMMSVLLFSHEFILASESLLEFETQVPQGLHPIEQRQGKDEFPLVQGDGCLSEDHHLEDEADYP